MVSAALHAEYEDSGSAVKEISRLTGASLDAVGNWYKGRNAPKSAHLIMLAQTYPQVHTIITSLIDLKPLSRVQVDETEVTGDGELYCDKIVVINVTVNQQMSGSLNQRQMWFLGRLQRGYNAKPVDIVNAWQSDFRTAQRDVAGLVKANLIHFVGAKRNGWYAAR
jgi:hypothetical protein